MQFPYTQLRSGNFRPKVFAVAWGNSGPHLLDGLLDTGADRTMIPLQVAINLGIDMASLGAEISVQSGTGQKLRCKTTHLILELRRPPDRIAWLAEIAIPNQHVGGPYWGFKGFLEYFRADFDGPNRVVTLTPDSILPAVTVP